MEILFYYIINLLYLGYFARRYWKWYLKAVGRGLLTDIDGIADAKHMVANENQMLILLYRLTKYKILKLRSAKDYFVLGNSLFLLAEYESAIECYNNALRIDGKGKYAWYNLGITLGIMGRYNDALVCWDELVLKDGQFKEAWFNRGITLGHLSKIEDALACYDRV